MSVLVELILGWKYFHMNRYITVVNLFSISQQRWH